MEMSLRPIFFFVLVLLSPLWPGLGWAQEKLELKVYVEEVLKANPSLQSAQFRAEGFQWRVKPAGSLDDPFFGVGPDDIAFNGEPGNVIRYQINQILPYPGKPITRGKVANAKAQAAASDVETTRRQLVLFATQVFYKTYLNQEAIRLNQETQKLIKALIETAKSRYETGEGVHHEWLLAKAELGVFETEYLKLSRERISLHALLNELRSQDPSTPMGVLKPDFSKTGPVELPKEEALFADQPERKALEKLADAAQLEKHLAKLGYVPDFMVQPMFAQRRGMEDPSSFGVMVGLNLPVFGYRKQAHLIKAADKDRLVALSDQKTIENKLKTEIVAARQQFQTAQDVVRLYQGTVIPQTRLALQSAQANYATGTVSAGSVLNLARIRLAQELELLSAKVDYEVGQLRIKELLSSPPIERFAPATPSLFFTEPMGKMGAGGGMQMPSSGAGMGGKGMSGPAGRPQMIEKGGAQEPAGGMGGGMP